MNGRHPRVIGALPFYLQVPSEYAVEAKVLLYNARAERTESSVCVEHRGGKVPPPSIMATPGKWQEER